MAASTFVACDGTKPVKRIVILVAMQQEARPFLEKHKLLPTEPSWPKYMPMKAYQGELCDCGIFLVWAGFDNKYHSNNVGTQAAAVSAFASIVEFSPDLVISAGTAGGFRSNGGQIGDVYVSTKCIFHGRRIPGEADGEYEEYGYGHFRSPPLGKLVDELRLKQGVISTGDSLHCSPLDLQLMQAEGAVVKEMEAASVAWVCRQARVPFLAVKSITDLVDGGKATEEEFYANLEMASRRLQDELANIVSKVANQPLNKWAWHSP